MGSIQQKMNLGIVWMVVARLMDRSIGIVSTLILARVLVLGDFGAHRETTVGCMNEGRVARGNCPLRLSQIRT